MTPFPAMLRTTLVLICHTAVMYLLTEPRPGVRHPLLFWIIVQIILEAIGAIMFIPFGMTIVTSSLYIIMLIIAYCTAFSLVSTGPAMKNLFLFMAYATYFMLAVCLSQLISDVFFSGSVSAVVAIRTAISVLFITILAFRLRTVFAEATRGIDSGWGKLTLFAGISCITVSLMVLASVFIIHNPRIKLFLLIILAFIVSSTFAVIIQLIRLMNSRNATNRQGAQKKLMESELESDRGFVEGTMRQQGDMLRHNRRLAEFLDEGDVEGAKAYLGDYETRLDELSIPVFCANRAVNAILGLASRRCAAAGIRLGICADVPEDIPLSAPEAVTVFGNIFENAEEACARVSDPFIDFTVRKHDGLLFVEMRNSVSGPVLWDGLLPRTRKKHGGIGLRSVSSVLGRYGGMLECSHDGDCFITRIILPL